MGGVIHVMGTMQLFFRHLSQLNNCKTVCLEQIKNAFYQTAHFNSSVYSIFFLRCFRLLKREVGHNTLSLQRKLGSTWCVVCKPTNTRFWTTRVLRSRKHCNNPRDRIHKQTYEIGPASHQHQKWWVVALCWWKLAGWSVMFLTRGDNQISRN